MHRLLPFLRVREGSASRRVDAPLERVFAAINADPTPDEMRRWHMTEFRRESPARATYLSRGRPTEASYEPLDPPRALRWTARGGGKVQTLDWRLAPEDGGTRVDLRAGLDFGVRAGHMARVLEDALDGLEARIRMLPDDASASRDV